MLTLESNIKPVRLKIHTVLDGTQMFTRFIEIENHSENNLAVSRVSLLSGGLEEIDKAQMTNERDISKLYSIDLKDNILGAVPDQFVQRTKAFRAYATTALGVDPDVYVNAGVLLMNLNEFRKCKIEEKFY